MPDPNGTNAENARNARNANDGTNGSSNPKNPFEGHEFKPDGSRFMELPARVFQRLPASLSKITAALSSGHERDLFLTGAMPVLASMMPQTRLKYGGHWQSLNTYVAVVAPASAGKRALRLAETLGTTLDERLSLESEAAYREWQQGQDPDAKSGDPRPPWLRIFAAADTSAAKINESLKDTPWQCVFETEAKTLGRALNQEWGSFRHVLLKGFHNEPISVDRKYAPPLRVYHPHPSLCLSGTPGSFEGVITDTEDGLFSRMCFYFFETPPVFIPQFQTDFEKSRDEAIQHVAQTVPSMFHILRDRAEPLYINIEDAERNIINEAGKKAMRHVVASGADLNLTANVKRAALVAFRFAAVMTVFDRHMNGTNLGSPKSLVVRPEYVKTGVQMAFTYLEHAVRLADAMKQGLERFAGDRDRFFAALPTGEIRSKRAVRIAIQDLHIPERSARRYLRQYVEAGRLEDRGYGKYFKHEPKDLSGVSFRRFVEEIK
jgi:hypothetical protein